MPARGQRKKPEAERRLIAKRYHTWRQNMPKRICYEHAINNNTMYAYAAEFPPQKAS